jgi:hypothetical protein
LAKAKLGVEVAAAAAGAEALKENEEGSKGMTAPPEPVAAALSPKANGLALNWDAASAAFGCLEPPAAIVEFVDGESVGYANEVAARLRILAAVSST